jgi:hypothetical protein
VDLPDIGRSYDADIATTRPLYRSSPTPPEGPNDAHPGVNMAAFTHSVQT